MLENEYKSFCDFFGKASSSTSNEKAVWLWDFSLVLSITFIYIFKIKFSLIVFVLKFYQNYVWMLKLWRRELFTKLCMILKPFYWGVFFFYFQTFFRSFGQLFSLFMLAIVLPMYIFFYIFINKKNEARFFLYVFCLLNNI